jgi:hypothetical protein
LKGRPNPAFSRDAQRGAPRGRTSYAIAADSSLQCSANGRFNAAMEASEFIRWFDDFGRDDVSTVGGKNASLGEMVRALKDKGVRVPDGFATTAEDSNTKRRKSGSATSPRRTPGSW